MINNTGSSEPTSDSDCNPIDMSVENPSNLRRSSCVQKPIYIQR